MTYVLRSGNSKATVLVTLWVRAQATALDMLVFVPGAQAAGLMAEHGGTVARPKSVIVAKCAQAGSRLIHICDSYLDLIACHRSPAPCRCPCSRRLLTACNAITIHLPSVRNLAARK
jgi:hypothetical protein